MEIIKSNIEKTDIEEYRNMIIQKENIKKEGIMWERKYYKEFGDLIKQSFELKVECILLKKQISFCQSKVNKNEIINRQSLDDYLLSYKDKYQKQIDDLTSTINEAKKERVCATESEYLEIKQIYRKIVKTIHPDIHPELFEKLEIQNLWNQVEEAYFGNDLDGLKSLDLLVSLAVDEDINDIDIPDIKDRIIDLKSQIKELLENKPYIFKNIICYPEEKIKVSEQLEKEIDDYKEYKDKLEKMLAKFKIEEW